MVLCRSNGCFSTRRISFSPPEDDGKLRAGEYKKGKRSGGIYGNYPDPAERAAVCDVRREGAAWSAPGSRTR
jgi:hypothetical protein